MLCVRLFEFVSYTVPLGYSPGREPRKVLALGMRSSDYDAFQLPVP